MSYTDSEPTSGGPLALLGVLIHDPDDPADTIRQYLYGRASRSTDVEVAQVSSVYAGRRYPVTDFGEHQQDLYSIQIDVPHGQDWRTDLDDLRAFMELRKALVLRDNRGRSMTGTMSRYREDDQPWGTQVGFTFSRVSSLEVVVDA